MPSLIMKLVAHRGWAAGGDENTLAAFGRAAADDRISGVEFDVRYAAEVATLVVSHDPPLDPKNTLTLDAALSFLAPTRFELLVEIKEAGIAPLVIEMLVAKGLADRSIVFAFASVARAFPWQDARPVRLGVIVMYPWNLGRVARRYAPDVLLLGWDDRVWTRLSFHAWWSVLSLGRLARRHRVPVVAGIVQRMKDLHWLAQQDVYAAVADCDRTIAAGR
jgi:hypothetical protein